MLLSTNPANTAEVLGQVQPSRADDVAQAVAMARAAQPAWQNLGVTGRVAALQKMADVFQANRTALIQAASREMGAPVALSAQLADGAEEMLAWNLAQAPTALAPITLYRGAGPDGKTEINQLVHEPFGVMACIMAWNFPYPNFIISATQALLAGNTVVVKYSEEIPLFSQLMERLVKQAGLPAGVVNFVYGAGEVGAVLAEAEIDLIGFTGSYATGQKLHETAAQKFIPIITELGGSSPGLVFADMALTDEVIANIFWARFANSAQFCDGLKRLLVARPLFDACVEKLAAYARARVIGDPMDPATEMGPLVAMRQVAKLQAQLADATAKGAQVVCGGTAPAGLAGAYFMPTLLTNIRFDMRVWTEEVFGPLLPIVPFDSVDEALQLANDTPYGLSAYVYTNDATLLQRAQRDLRAGSVTAYGAHIYRPQNPFGGYKKSGLGREGGVQGFHDVTQSKVLAWIE